MRCVVLTLAAAALMLIVCQGIGAGGVSTAEPASGATVRSELNQGFQRLLDELHLSAIGAGIVTRDHLVWAGHYGWADPEARRPVGATTLFHMGSVSKTLTALVAMRLWEQGGFQLDDDINRYLAFAVRNPRFPDTPLTFRMLLTHTSTIADIDRTGFRKELAALYGSTDPTLGLGDVTREFLAPGGRWYAAVNYSTSEPGTRWEYSNIAFALLGHLVERISGMSFDEYCRKHLLTPLDMPDTTYRLAETRLDRFAFPSRPDPQVPGRLARVTPFTWPGYTDGSLRTSITEYAHLLSMVLNEGRYEGRQVLKPTTVALILTPQRIPAMPPARGTIAREDYALGWAVHRLKGDLGYMHNGFGTGFGT